MILTIKGHVLYADGIDVNVLVVMLYNSFARSHHSGKLGKGHLGSLLITSLLQWHVNL